MKLINNFEPKYCKTKSLVYVARRFSKKISLNMLDLKYDSDNFISKVSKLII